MTDKLRALVEKWRGLCPYKSSSWEDVHHCLDQCADELEAVTATDAGVHWCLHLRGPDDVFAAPSKEAARVERADVGNAAPAWLQQAMRRAA